VGSREKKDRERKRKSSPGPLIAYTDIWLGREDLGI
jgi:hypothetical protein